VSRPEQVPAVLERVAASGVDALYVANSPLIESRMREIGAFALRRKLVSIGTSNSFVLDGEGLISYSPIAKDLIERAATHIDRILRGAKPAELPVDLPSKFALMINARTARAIGFTVPPGLLVRADRVIE
jgi:putative ABC transport system substrate-binding protein